VAAHTGRFLVVSGFSREMRSMDNPAGLDPHRPDHAHGFSAAVRTILGLTAFAVTLLPIPVVYFGILPAYQRHSWFLLFYTPFLCLLTLCYLFYVRDSLGRAIFANVLDPPPPRDPYYREPMSEQVKRGFRYVKAIFVGILPVLLVLTSMYCISRYLSTLDQSVTRAVRTYQERSIAGEPSGALPEERGSSPRRKLTRQRAAVTTDSVRSSVRDSLPFPLDSSAVRQYVLRTSAIGDIPEVTELSVFYMGAFVALLVAVTLMALKEYAKEALGLSEHELMFGRYRPGVTEE
jgi:hypothetical protein